MNHTRPRSSIIGLCDSVWLSQMGSGPQNADGPNGLVFEDGVCGSRTGCCQFGDRVHARVEHRQEVGAVLSRRVHLSVGVDSWVAPIGRDRIVKIRSGTAPVPHRDHKIALDAPWAIRLCRRELAGGDAVGPVGEQT